MKNLIPEVAALLGVEIGEEFDIKETEYNPWKFTETGVADRKGNVYATTLHNLLTGVETIIKKPWEPEKGSKYYYIDTEGNVDYNWFENAYDHAMLDSGNCFRTEQEAEANQEAIMEKFGWK